MNKAEARDILAREILHFRAMSYSDLQNLMGSPQVVERSGARCVRRPTLCVEAVQHHSPMNLPSGSIMKSNESGESAERNRPSSMEPITLRLPPGS